LHESKKEDLSVFPEVRELNPDQKTMRFSREEAQALVGHRVRTVAGVDGVPMGTFGNVMHLDEIEKDNFELIVEWYVLIDGKRQHDWFSKEQYEQCLIDDPELDLSTTITVA
jgi:hypothetical protein